MARSEIPLFQCSEILFKNCFWSFYFQNKGKCTIALGAYTDSEFECSSPRGRESSKNNDSRKNCKLLSVGKRFSCHLKVLRLFGHLL